MTCWGGRPGYTVGRMTTHLAVHRIRVRWWLVTALAFAIACFAAAGARASTIAYVDGTSNDVYVADSTGADPVEVATGVSSPSLAANGDLYVLNSAGSAVDVYAPGVGASSTIPISASGANQLAVSPSGGSLAWTTGSLFSTPTTVGVLTVKSNTTQTIANGMYPHWATFGRLAVSSLNISTLAHDATIDYFNRLAIPTWSPGMTGIFANLVLEYAPNPQGTLAAAVVDQVGPGPTGGPALVVFPINPLTLAPTGGNPAATLAWCGVDPNFSEGPGDSVAWAPNGSALAYNTTDGISQVTVGKWTGSCSQIGAPQLVIADGYDPSWGPSNDRDFPAPSAG
jgi:hypothetical protein